MIQPLAMRPERFVTDHSPTCALLVHHERCDCLKGAHAKIARIREIHIQDGDLCGHCKFTWPCLTIEALEG